MCSSHGNCHLHSSPISSTTGVRSDAPVQTDKLCGHKTTRQRCNEPSLGPCNEYDSAIQKQTNQHTIQLALRQRLKRTFTHTAFFCWLGVTAVPLYYCCTLLVPLVTTIRNNSTCRIFYTIPRSVELLHFSRWGIVLLQTDFEPVLWPRT